VPAAEARGGGAEGARRVPVRDPTIPPAGQRRPEDASWDSIGAVFDRVDEVDARESASSLELDWERPDVFVEPSLDDIGHRLEDIARRVEAIDRRSRETARPIGAELVRRLDELSKGMSSLERRMQELSRPTPYGEAERHRLDEIAQVIASLDRRLKDPSRALLEGMAVVEKRLQELGAGTPFGSAEVERFQRLVSGAFEAGLARIMEREEQAAKRFEEIGEKLRQELTSLAEQIPEAGAGDVRKLLGEVGERLSSVEARVGDVGPLVENLFEGLAQTLATELLDRLDSVDALLQEMAASGDPGEAMAQVVEQVAELHERTGEQLAAGEERVGERLAELTAEVERLAGVTYDRTVEMDAHRKLVDQVNEALTREPFDIVSAKNVDAASQAIATKVTQLAGRVDRLESALDRGLAGLEESRRAAATAARDIAASAKRIEQTLTKAGVPPEGARKRAPRRAAKRPARRTAP